MFVSDLVQSLRASTQEARDIQVALKEKVSTHNSFESLSSIRVIAGCDMAIDTASNQAFACACVYSFPNLERIETRFSTTELEFPYVPGLLSFREGKPLMTVISQIDHDVDLYIFDGHGISHPRGLGIASHLGLILNKPTIGCAKSKLIGSYTMPDMKKGSTSPLYNKNKVIGEILRTKDKVSPVFVSSGHLIDLPTAIYLIIQCCDGYRIPKPTREADREVARYKKSQLEQVLF